MTAPASPDSHVVSPDGTRIACWTLGAGPPLVLVHGTADDHSIWTAVMEPLSARSRVIAYDRRGRGESGDHSAHSIEKEAEDLAAVVASAGAPVRLLGHSYGCLVALAALPRISERVQRLVLYEAPYRIPIEAKHRDRLEKHLAAGDEEGILTTFVLDVARGAPDELAMVRSMPPVWEQMKRVAHTIPREVEAVTRFRLRGPHPPLLPTLLLQGTRSDRMMTGAARALLAAMPAAEIAVEQLEGQGHLAMVFAPELFAGAVDRFLG